MRSAGSSFEAGIPKDLFDSPVVDDTNRRNRYVVTPDGQRFLFVTAPKTPDATPFIVVQNWQTLLKH